MHVKNPTPVVPAWIHKFVSALNKCADEWDTHGEAAHAKRLRKKARMLVSGYYLPDDE